MYSKVFTFSPFGEKDRKRSFTKVTHPGESRLKQMMFGYGDIKCDAGQDRLSKCD